MSQEAQRPLSRPRDPAAEAAGGIRIGGYHSLPSSPTPSRGHIRRLHLRTTRESSRSSTRSTSRAPRRPAFTDFAVTSQGCLLVLRHGWRRGSARTALRQRAGVTRQRRGHALGRHPPRRGGDDENRLIGITPLGGTYVFARNAHPGMSEFAGPTFSPDGHTLFVNIQTPGIRFAVWDPFARQNHARHRQMAYADPPAKYARRSRASSRRLPSATA